MNNGVFGKTMENVRKYRNIKLATSDRKRNYLLPEPNYHTTEFFTENLLAINVALHLKLKASNFHFVTNLSLS